MKIAKIFLKFAEVARIGHWGAVVDGEGELGFLLF